MEPQDDSASTIANERSAHAPYVPWALGNVSDQPVVIAPHLTDLVCSPRTTVGWQTSPALAWALGNGERHPMDDDDDDDDASPDHDTTT